MSQRTVEETKRLILDALRSGATLDEAATAAGTSRDKVYELRKSDADFAGAVKTFRNRQRPKRAPRPRPQPKAASREQVELYAATRAAGNSKTSALKAAQTKQVYVQRACTQSPELAELVKGAEELVESALRERRRSKASLQANGVRILTCELGEILADALNDDHRRMALATTHASIFGVDVQTATRHVLYVATQQSTTVSAECADSLLLADQKFLGFEDATHITFSPIAAREMVNVWASDRTPREQAALARKLANFSRGFAAAMIDRLELLDEHQEQEQAA